MGRLRAEVLAYLRTWGSPTGDYAAAELILGELLSNAGRHTPGPICVDVDWTQAYARLSVHDAGRGFEWRPALPVGGSEHGRGLYIVASLARGVSVERALGGCRVTVTLPVRIGTRTALVGSCVERRSPERPGVCPAPARRIGGGGSGGSGPRRHETLV